MNTHSDDFEKFLSQLNAQGYEKGQGFDIELLKRLNFNEKNLAINYLKEALEKGDFTAASALASIGSKKAQIILEEKLKYLLPPSLLHSEISIALWRMTNNQKFQDLLLENLKEKDEIKRLAILQGVLSINPNDRLEKELMILAETDQSSSIRALAAAGVLYCKGKIKNPKDYDHSYMPLLRGIASKDSTTRRTAIDKFKIEKEK